MRLILGSSSPARQKVLRQMGYDFDVIKPFVKPIKGEPESVLGLPKSTHPQIA